MCAPKTGAAAFKEKVDIIQGLVTIAAIIIGGIWTYNVFIKERREYPHANIEQKITHLALSDQQNLLQLGLELTNTGTLNVGRHVDGSKSSKYCQYFHWRLAQMSRVQRHNSSKLPLGSIGRTTAFRGR